MRVRWTPGVNSVKGSLFSLNSASHNWLQMWCYTFWTHFPEKWQQLILEIYVRAIISERKVSKDWRFNWTKEPDKMTQKVWRDNDLCQSPGMWSCVDKKNDQKTRSNSHVAAVGGHFYIPYITVSTSGYFNTTRDCSISVTTGHPHNLSG